MMPVRQPWGEVLAGAPGFALVRSGDGSRESAICLILGVEHRTRCGREPSFEHCVGAQHKRFRYRQPHGLRSLEIDGQLELRGLLYGQVFRLPAL